MAAKLSRSGGIVVVSEAWKFREDRTVRGAGNSSEAVRSGGPRKLA
ncbi:MAG: hypothetical protein LBT40_02465 [Deltaproteobacteria bacterium]|nr:hypothetical protein [Deltaproteobacteria bacterium]